MQCDENSFIETYLNEFKNILNAMISGMCCAELNNSISHNFIVQMIPHHMAAIEMSKNILKYTKNKELIEIANGIISEQTESVDNMQLILSSCDFLKNYNGDLKTYQNNVCRIMAVMIKGMRNAYSDNCVDCDFIREMVPHHIGAVRMSKNALNFSICSELKPVLNAIIASQEKGICRMRNLSLKLKCR